MQIFANLTLPFLLLPRTHSPWKPLTPLHLTLGSFKIKSPSEILQAAFTFPLISKLCEGTVYPASRCLKVPRFLVWLRGECRTRVRNGPVCVKRLLVWGLYGKDVWDECRWAFCFLFFLVWDNFCGLFVLFFLVWDVLRFIFVVVLSLCGGVVYFYRRPSVETWFNFSLKFFPKWNIICHFLLLYIRCPDIKVFDAFSSIQGLFFL